MACVQTAALTSKEAYSVSAGCLGTAGLEIVLCARESNLRGCTVSQDSDPNRPSGPRSERELFQMTVQNWRDKKILRSTEVPFKNATTDAAEFESRDASNDARQDASKDESEDASIDASITATPLNGLDDSSGFLTCSMDCSADRSADWSVDEPKIHWIKRCLSVLPFLKRAPNASGVRSRPKAAPAPRPAMSTPLGDRALALIVSPMARNVSFTCSVIELANVKFPGPTGWLFTRLSKRMSEGLGVVELLEHDRLVFGDLAAAFARIGERSVGSREALQRYLRHRRELNVFSYSLTRPWGPTSDQRSIRTFALTLGELLDMNSTKFDFFDVSLIPCLDASMLELPPRLQRKMRPIRSAIKGGLSLHEALPRPTLFFGGLEPNIYPMVDAGERLCELPLFLKNFARS